METQPNPDLRVVDEGAAAADPPPPAERLPARTRPTKPLPTPRIAFAKQLDVLRGWAIASGPEARAVSNKQVADIVKIAADTLTLANSFFSDAKLLQKADGGYAPTPVTVNFNQAYAWSPETAAHKLAPALANAWFGQALLPRLEFSSISEDEAVQVLAETATAAPTYRSQLLLILDYLAVAGLVVREAGQVAMGTRVSEAEPPAPTPSNSEHPTPDTPKTGVATAFAQTAEGQIQFNVSFRVGMAEFAEWHADRIAAFFNGIAQVLAAKADVEKGATR